MSGQNNFPVMGKLVLTESQEKNLSLHASLGESGMYVVLVLFTTDVSPRLRYANSALELRVLHEKSLLEGSVFISNDEMQDEITARRVNVARFELAQIE